MAVEGEQARFPKGSPYDHGGGGWPLGAGTARPRHAVSGLDLSAET